MPLLFFLSFLIFGAGAAGLATPFSAPSEPVDTISVSKCYQLEQGTKVTVDSASLTADDCRTQIDSKTYLRLRQQVKITQAKINEGSSSAGTCTKGSSRLRKIGLTIDGKEVWWLDKNYKNQITEDFILILLKKDEGHHHFDVYIDAAEKDKLATDPKYEFIRNCKETGGLIPVVEGPTTPTFPPQALSLTDHEFNNQGNQSFDVDGFSDNFEKYREESFEGKYFMRIDPPAGDKVEIPERAEPVGLFYKTIDGETRTYDVLFHVGIVYLRDQSDDKPYMYNPSDTKPPFSVKRDPTLQLAALKFITVSEWTWATPECKPALYLYPEKPTRLRVVLKPTGKLTVTDPVYDPKTGWQVLAHPDGTLEPITYPDKVEDPRSKHRDNLEPRTYSYLFYEAEIEKVKTPKKGWVVKKKALEALFDEILPRLGLNQNESLEFKKYWVGALNGSPYYFVGLIDRDEIERIEPIEFSQDPDTFIRIRLFFEPLEERIYVEAPDLSSAPDRQGFTAVDWGGILSSGTCQAGEAFDIISR